MVYSIALSLNGVKHDRAPEEMRLGRKCGLAILSKSFRFSEQSQSESSSSPLPHAACTDMNLVTGRYAAENVSNCCRKKKQAAPHVE